MSYEAVEVECSDQIVITLHEQNGVDLRVRSVDLFANAMKVRFSSQATSVETTFQRDIAYLIRRICQSATLSKQIINVPDFCLRLRGLSIDGYTLLVHTLENGVRQFIIRLKRAFGNALALFRMSEMPSDGLSLMGLDVNPNGPRDIKTDRLFDEMLSHLYLPLVNLNRYLRDVLDGQNKPSRDHIDASMVQLKTKAEVLQFAFDRVISEMTLESYTGTAAQQLPAIEHEVH